MTKKGFYWHVHHDKLFEWCYDYDKRVEFIRVKKNKSELDLRLKLFQPIKSELPKELVEAEQAYFEAEEAIIKMWVSYFEAKQAYKNALINNAEFIEKLHSLECPNCPWDGETIFP